MNLSPAILVETLSAKLSFVHIRSSIDLCISDVRLYSPDDTACEEGGTILYLLRPEQLSSYFERSVSDCFAVACCDPEITIPEEMEYFIFSPGICFESAFSALQRVFHDFRLWESALLQGMIRSCSMEELMVIAAQPLYNPLALFDVSFVLIATGGEIPAGQLDSTWADVMREGYFPMGVQDRKKEDLLWNAHQPFRTRVGNTIKASTCIRSQGNIVGYLGMTNLQAPITDGQLSILYAIQTIFESHRFFYSIQRFSTLLTRLLLGYSVETSVIDYYLKSLSWHKCRQFCLLILTNATGTALRDGEISSTIHRLKDIFHDSLIFPFEDCIVIVSAVTDPEDRTCLNSILHDMQLLCIKSLSFYPFSYIRHAYLQCRMVLACAPPCQPGVLSFDEKYQDCVLSAMSDSISLTALCNPYIFNLKDKKNGMDFIHSLRIFLMHGKNYSEASAELHVHRNTLIYRIERMEEYLGMNFHAANEQTLFQLYLSCLISEKSTAEFQEKK